MLAILEFNEIYELNRWIAYEAICQVQRPDFTKQPRIDATYGGHAKILQAIQSKRGDQAALLLRSYIQTSQAKVRKITLHQVHLARQAGGGAAV